jgi:hypothetical protein
MKVTLSLGCILISLSPFAYGQRLSANDPNYQLLSQLSNSIGWYRVSNTNAWDIGDADADRSGARCMETLDKLRAAGVPDTRTIEVQWESPEFKPGVHTLADIRRSCEHVARLGKIKDFEKWAILAMQAGTHYSSGAIYYKQCVQSYNLITKGGVAPTDRVPDRVIGSTQWSGSIEEIRQKYCDNGMTMASEKNTAHEAPFRKELAGDKLRIALKYGSVFLPGGMGTADPHKMAAASTWFLDLSPPRMCVDGRQVHTIRRYQFDGEKLVSTTSKDYCGGAPRSAFQ